MRANDGTRTAAEVLIDQLVIHGVRQMFCVPGESYLEVLDAETRLFVAELGVVNAREDELHAYVELYRALGGGWTQ